MTMDLFPTIADISGATIPENLKLDGENLMPLLLEEKKLWKYLVKGEDEQLYNLDDDIGETNNLAQSRPDLVQALRAEYLAWEKDVTDGVKWIRK
jgi:arylsulfatase A-like enzyme